MFTSKSASIFVLAVAFATASAFAPSSSMVHCNRQATPTAIFGKMDPAADDAVTRRSVIWTASMATMGTLLASGAAVAGAEEPDGRDLNAFNTLTFGYRGSEFGGLDASTLTEPSVPYKEFLEKLTNEEVAFVEFLAPDGDVAYATFKTKDGTGTETPIRIGEGYPIEQHNGYSSPAFAVRSVANKKVPYKFTVPGLAKYK
eukprot:CAMPEP_0198287484 /NCGR_PEP_ID=MMETSP1449-20131203/6273_1 /TAXON_ID=420275 /ORGANISM="Attheya septentrionalis, Strain CCMP2084" /LENGTH=200 /DNA_ID=CAMNT_0043985443 /DNA_START=119 /DNA_END=721 /DNA_ORIENTATION=-